MSVSPTARLTTVPTRPGMEARSLVGPEQGITTFFVAEDRMATGAHIPLHTHPVPEVLVVTDGELTVTLDAETHTVAAGHTVVVPPGTAHRLANAGPAHVTFLAAAAWNRDTFFRDGSTYLEGGPR